MRCSIACGPPIAESGLPGYDMDVWLATMVPACVPAGNIARVQAEIARTLAQQGTEAASSTTQELVTLIRQDYARYGNLIKDAGIKGE